MSSPLLNGQRSCCTKMGKEYFEKKDARMRLLETICIYDGKPVFVYGYDENSNTLMKVVPLRNAYTVYQTGEEIGRAHV